MDPVLGYCHGLFYVVVMSFVIILFTFFFFQRFIPSRYSWYGGYFLKAYPLDMVQYERLFNMTRLPRPEKDELVGDHAHGHVIVMRNGHMYSIQAQQPDGECHTVSYHVI